MSAARSPNAGASRSRNASSGADMLGSISRCCSIRAPSPSPTRRSRRYSPAHASRPGSTGRSNVANSFETPPVEVMTTTIATSGCSASTSTWRIVAVLSDGAETTASRLVICESVSDVVRIACSTSRRISDSSIRRCTSNPSPELSIRSTIYRWPVSVGTRPAETCGCASRPCSSSSASSLRIVDGPQSKSGSAAIDFDATGWPVRR
jgi:hypothetical protein